MDKYNEVMEELRNILDKYSITAENAIEILNAIIIEEPKKMRKTQYYPDKEHGVWCYLIKGERNPCGCGSNCYHYEYNKEDNIIYGVCNACHKDIYILNEPYVNDKLNEGLWL